MRAGRKVYAVLAVLLFMQPMADAQLSKPVADDSNVNTTGNKFLSRSATADARIGTGKNELQDEEIEDTCPQNIAVKWHAEASSAIYATPLITDLFSDGTKNIVVPAFLHNLEVFEGRDGAKAPGFEAFHASTAHTSPLLYDIDLDGVPDIVLATYDGEILFFKDTGEQAATRLSIPRLRVRRDWHAGLFPDPNDHSNPDVGSAEFKAKMREQQERQNAAAFGGAAKAGTDPKGQQAQRAQQAAGAGTQKDQAQQAQAQQQAAGTAGVKQAQQQGSQQAQQAQAQGQAQQAQQAQQQEQQGAQQAQAQAQGAQQVQQQDTAQQQAGAAQGATAQQRQRSLLQAQAGDVGQEQQQQAADVADAAKQAAGAAAGGRRGGSQQAAGVENGEELSEEAAESFGELFAEGDDADGAAVGDDAFFDAEGADEEQPLLDDDQYVGKQGRYEEPDDHKGKAGQFVFKPKVVPGRRPEPRLPSDKLAGHRGKQERPQGWEHDDTDRPHTYEEDYSLMGEKARMWQDEFYHQRAHGAAGAPPNPFVYIDAHILTTPAIADIDGDGVEELVVAVSYFFDRQYYEKEGNRLELGKDLDMGQYVASGVVVFDLHRRSIKWSQHLDLSTDYTSFKAYAYSAPTLADVDGDGKLEVILGTSMGFLYVLDCYGVTRPGFPLQMGDIQAQVSVADVNADGRLEMVAGDSRGNLAAFDATGKEVWETHLQSQIHQTPVFGDVDGDGELEVVVTTFSGHVHVLDAATGQPKGPFPFRAFGKIMAPPLLTKLDDAKEPGLQIIVTAFDGFLYVIDGHTGCADSLDLGETSYAQVLADDLDGNGRLDLLVATMNGNLYCIATGAPNHPLKSWPQQHVGGGTFTARWGWEGVYVTTESRKPRDVRGHMLPLRFKIIDQRPPVAGAAVAAAAAEKGAAAKSAGGKVADEEEQGGGSKGNPRSSKRKPPAGRGPYKVSIMLTGVGTREMNAGEHPVIGMADVLNATGAFTMEIPCPRSRSTATIRVEMRDESKLLFVDEFSLSFHIHFYRLLKWLIVAPFAAAAVALLAYRPDREVHLPE